MANQIVLEELVVRLMGTVDASYAKITKAFTDSRTEINRLYTALMRVERFAGTLFKGLGSFGLASGVRGLFNQFADMEQGQIKLNAAIESNGRAIADVMPQYKAFAEAETRFSLDTKGTVFSLLQQAEMMGHSGDVAMRLVKNAMDLADATDQEASSMLRVAEAMERGNYQMLRRLPGLRGIKDETLLVKKANEMMARGAAIDAAMFDSAHGRVTRLSRAFKDMSKEIGGMIAKVFLPLVGMLQQAFDAFRRLEPATKHQIAMWMGLAIAWLGMGPVTQVIKDLLTPTAQLIKFLVIELPLMTAKIVLWTAWKAILLVTGVVMTGLGIVAAVLTGNLAALKAVVILLSAALGVQAVMAKIAAVANAVWAASTLTAIASLVTAGAALAAILYVGYAAISAVVRVFSNLPSMAAPINAITRMLSEWWTMLKEVYLVAQNDLPKAWEMLRAGLSVAMSQMRDAWDPLWNYIRQGFSAVWQAVADVFRARMFAAINAVSQALPLVPNGIGLRGVNVAPVINEENVLATLSTAFFNLNRNFNIVESDATRAARAAYTALRPIDGAARQAAGGVNVLHRSMENVRKEAQRFDAALADSAEAMTRIAEYQDRISVGRERATPTPGLSLAQQGAVSAAAAVGMGSDQVVGLLSGILNAVKGATVLNVRPAALGNP